MYNTQRSGSGCGLGGGRLIVGLLMAAFALISYFASQEYNPITNENQHINISPQQEVQWGFRPHPKWHKNMVDWRIIHKVRQHSTKSAQI